MKYFLFILGLSCLGIPSYSSNIDINNETLPLKLGQRLEVFSLKGQKVDLGQILAQWTDEFKLSTQSVPSFGFNQSGWGRFTILNSTDEIQQAYVEHHYIHTDEVILFQKNSLGEYESAKLGDNQVLASPLRPYRYPLFSINIFPGKNTYYVRSSSRESTTLPLILKNHEQVIVDGQLLWIQLCLLSVFVSMIFLLYLFFKYRDNKSLFYSLFCLGFILNHILIEGLLGVYWPQRNWPYLMNEGHFLAALFYQFFLTLGTMSLLKWRKINKIFNFLLKLALGSTLGLFISFFLFEYVDLVKPYFINAFFVLIVFVIILLYQIANRNRDGIIYSISWSHGVVIFFLYLYNFSTGNYSHSIGFLVSGTIHLWGINVWFYKLTKKKMTY